MKTIRRLAVYSATVIVAAATAVAIAPASPASAHGAAMKPGSRTYLCWRDGLAPTGDIQPTNAACQQAVQAGGTNPLYNWFSVLQSNAGGQTTGFIPDGKLCSGNNPVFAAYDAANNNWPLTHLTAGRSMEFWYSNWAHHPGTFYFYVTRDGFNPNTPLRWSDLESPFLTVTNPPQQGAVGTNDGHYYFTGNLPSNKSGRHIIYSRWVRSDSNENFFGCSDVVFDGGNGEVTGIRNTPTNPTTQPTTPPTSRQTTPPTTPPTRATTPPTTPTGNNGGVCSATYRQVGSWPGGFQGEVTIRAGSSAIPSWTSTLAVSGGTVTQLWGGTMTAGSPTVVRNASWNGALSPNATATYGFIGNGTGASATVTCASP